MADYTTFAKVTAVLPKDVQLDATSDPAYSEVAVWITQVTATVDVALAAGGLSVQPTDTDQLAALDILVAQEVAYKVMISVGGAQAADTTPVYFRWHDEFEKALDLMRAGDWAQAAGSTGGAGFVSSYTMDAPSTTDETINARFTRDREY